ncbi:MAG: chromate transporter [Cellulosilyticaceae bacterium]
MTLLLLYAEFFRIGLFAVGGGLATIPFLQELITKYGWFTSEDLLNMIAVAESTPGPIGVNAATYIGYQVGGLLGGLLAVIGLVTPSIIVIVLVAKIFNRFKELQGVKNAFYGIRPVVAGLIGAVSVEVMKVSLWGDGRIQLKAIILLGAFLIAITKWKKHPILYIVIGGVVGILFKL